MKKIYFLSCAFLLRLNLIEAQTNVTFQVDMNQQTGFTTPEVNGTFNNWCGSSCNPLSDANGDGIWETTIALAPGNYEYKFAADNWLTQESLLPGSPCTNTTSGFTNRTLTVGSSAMILPIVCWGSCSACVSGNALKITVDLCGQNSQNIRLTGAFWNWTWNAGPVAASNGNGTWTFTLNPPPAAAMEYLIVSDSVQENLIAEMQNGGTCAPITDYFSFANRVWTPGDPDSVYIIYNHCTSCVSGIEEKNEKNIKAYPNPAKNSLYVNLNIGTKKIQLINLLGDVIYERMINNNDTNASVNLVNFESGFYLLRTIGDNFIFSKQIIIEK